MIKNSRAKNSTKDNCGKQLKRISAIELHIRSSEEGLGDTAEGILAKAEAQVAERTEETETGMKRESKIYSR